MKQPRVSNKPNFKMDTLHAALKDGLKAPYIGVTQGGSSRKNSGARPAAKSSTTAKGSLK